MSHHRERRNGEDRRKLQLELPRQFRERRRDNDRRQLDVQEISFFQWASSFVKYQSERGNAGTEQTADLLEKIHHKY